MTTQKPIRLKLLNKWAGSNEITFNTNLGTKLILIDYQDGVMTIDVEKGISIQKTAELVEACFLPGSEFTKRSSMFIDFKEIKFTFNDIQFCITKENCSAQEIVSKYYWIHR